MPHSLRWVLPVVLLLTPSPALWSEEKEKLYRPQLDDAAIEKSLGTEWFGLYLVGQKIGWARVDFQKAGDKDNPSYIAKMELRGKVKSFGVETILDGTETNEFDGKP